MSRIRTLGAAAVLAAAPLAVLPGGLFPFQLPKITVVFLGVLLAASAPAAGRLPRTLAWLTAAALGWLALTSALSADSPFDLLGRYPRYEGALALTAAAGALWAAARLFGGAGGASAEARLWFARTTAAGSIGVACVGVVEATGARPVAGGADERVGSLLGNATDQGVFAAVVALVLLPFALDAWRRGRPADTALFALAELAAAVALALSGSRGAMLGLTAGGTTVLLATWWIHRRLGTRTHRPGAVRPSLVAAATGALIAATLLLAVLLPATSARLTGADAAARASASGRLLIWERTLGLALDHPLLGLGGNGFAAAILGRTDVEWAQRVGFAHPLDSPHNWLLQVFVVGGIPLLALAGAWMVVAGRAAVRPLLEPATLPTAQTWQRSCALAGVVAAGVAMLTHVTSRRRAW